MKKIFNPAVLLVLAIMAFTNLHAQVGIGTTAPNADAELDITSTTRGLLLPRLALTNTTSPAPLTADVAGMVVYNTATAGDVTPGFYYNDGTDWIRLGGGATSNDWTITGNAGTNPVTNFVGTTDAQDLVLRSNNTERLRLGTTEAVVNEGGNDNDFRVETDTDNDFFFIDAGAEAAHIADSSPFPGIDVFTVRPVANLFAINGYALGQGNAAVYGRHETNASGGNTNVAAGFDGGSNGYPIIADYTMGAGIGGNEVGALISSNNTTGDRWGLISRNDSGGGTIGSEAMLAGVSDVPRPPAEGGPPQSNEFYGGYFNGNQTTGDYAYVGLNYRGTDYKIVGAGSVSTIVKDTKGHERILFCPEAPEILFEDYGSGKLVNGEAYINIDPIFAKNIVVNEKHPLRVFIQLEGDCNGVYTAEKTKKGFKVKELNNGKSNTTFSWHIVANRIDGVDQEGNIESKHEGVRFPYGPKKLKPLKYGKAKVPTRTK